MSIGLIDSLTPAQRRFVLLDNVVGAFVVNLLLNGAIAWLLFRKATHVPMWGKAVSPATLSSPPFCSPRSRA
jgi:hypothetical protein